MVELKNLARDKKAF